MRVAQVFQYPCGWRKVGSRECGFEQGIPPQNEIFPSCNSHREGRTDGGDFSASVEPSVVALMWVKIAVGIESGDNRVATGDPQTCSYNLPVTHIRTTR